jgi:Transposase, Mutator family
MDDMSMGELVRGPAQEAVDRLLDQGFLDDLMSKVDEGGVQLTGEGGFLPELVRRVLEAGLQAELTDHLGYEKHDRAGHGSGNSRNGFTPKRLGTEVGDLDLTTPRDRNGSFEPQLVPKGARRLGGLSDMIISLYAGGMTIRDIQAHLERTLGTQLSHDIKNAAWRPFQLAFVLLNLPALTHPDAEERRERVDLLFFPTGGGKTEAYLGLAAYAFAIRRLQGVLGQGEITRDGGAGVAVLMRYTLRLLTAQQFSRAAALVCAAEVIRRRDPATWGDQRFSIGLWVGMSVSPNWYGDAAQSIANARESGRRGSKIPVLQTSYCPWCAEPLLGERDLHADDALRRIVVYCPRGEGPDPCPFSRRSSPLGIPVMTVDEEVYREPPSLLIATVDKLAQLPWYGFAGMLFGRVSSYCPRHGYRHRDLDERIGCGVRHNASGRLTAVTSQQVLPLRPPDLIIQDELHLISGALGSTVGLFEAAVEELTSWVTPSGVRTSPKIIASTATTKRAPEQVQQLFARELSVFPPQVLDARDTFFSVEEAATPERARPSLFGLLRPRLPPQGCGDPTGRNPAAGRADGAS